MVDVLHQYEGVVYLSLEVTLSEITYSISTVLLA